MGRRLVDLGALRARPGDRARADGRSRSTSPFRASPSEPGALWVAGLRQRDGPEGRSERRAGSSLRVRVGTGPGSLAFAAGDLWVANRLDSTVSRIDPRRPRGPRARSRSAAALRGARARCGAPCGSPTSTPPACRGSIHAGTPRRPTVAVGGQPTSLTVAGGKLWAGCRARACEPSGRHARDRLAADIPDQSIRRSSPSDRAARVRWAWRTTRWSRSSTPAAPTVCASCPIWRWSSRRRPTAGEPTRSGCAPGSATPNGVAVQRRRLSPCDRAAVPARSELAGTDFYARIVGAAGCVRNGRHGATSRAGSSTDDAAARSSST